MLLGRRRSGDRFPGPGGKRAPGGRRGRPGGAALLLSLGLAGPALPQASPDPATTPAAVQAPTGSAPRPAVSREASTAPRRARRPRDPPRRELRDPGGYPFRTPAASPLEPLPRLAVARVSRDTADGTVALADLGVRLPFWLHRDDGGTWELAGSVAAGAFSRFDLESSDNEFIEVHYRAALRLRARYGDVAARLELYHASSHLGDELLVRTGRRPISTSREGVELLLQGAPLPGFLVYAGPGLLLRSSEELAPASLRAGTEWTASSRGSVSPYVALEAFAWAEPGWDPTVVAEAGIGIGSRVRLAVTLGRGPSRAEQFFREDETVAGLLFVFRD